MKTETVRSFYYRTKVDPKRRKAPKTTSEASQTQPDEDMSVKALFAKAAAGAIREPVESNYFDTAVEKISELNRGTVERTDLQKLQEANKEIEGRIKLAKKQQKEKEAQEKQDQEFEKKYNERKLKEVQTRNQKEE